MAEKACAWRLSAVSCSVLSIFSVSRSSCSNSFSRRFGKAAFKLGSDGVGGTLVTDPPLTTSNGSLLGQSHA